MRKLAVMINAAMAAAVLCFGGASHGARAQDGLPGDAVEGKRLYLAVGCFACHGRSGKGGAMNGPAPILAKTAMPFDGFKGQLRQPANDMPVYSQGVMSDKEIADIYAFVQASCCGEGIALSTAPWRLKERSVNCSIYIIMKDSQSRKAGSVGKRRRRPSPSFAPLSRIREKEIGDVGGQA